MGSSPGARASGLPLKAGHFAGRSPILLTPRYRANRTTQPARGCTGMNARGRKGCDSTIPTDDMLEGYGRVMTEEERAWGAPALGAASGRPTESEQLIGAIERQRATFSVEAPRDSTQLACGGGSDHVCAHPRGPPQASGSGRGTTSSNRRADWRSRSAPRGDAIGWDGSDDDWEFTTSLDDNPGGALCALARRGSFALGRGSKPLFATAGSTSRSTWGRSTEGRTCAGFLCDLIEEYARHTGHADLLREAADGRVGEDPPESWQPRGCG